jgi:hypothetical protein
MKEVTWGKELMQCEVYTQKDSGLEEHIEPTRGGVKRPHESSDSDKEQPS